MEMMNRCSPAFEGFIVGFQRKAEQVMASFANPVDVLGLAVADKIVLRDPTGGLREDAVEMLDKKGIYIPAAGARDLTERESHER